MQGCWYLFNAATLQSRYSGLPSAVRHVQTAAEMFVMVLDVHKWVPMPAIAARAKQSSSSAALPAGGSLCFISLCSKTPVRTQNDLLSPVLLHVCTGSMGRLRGCLSCRRRGPRASLCPAGAHAAGCVHKRPAVSLQRAQALRPAVPLQPCCPDPAGKLNNLLFCTPYPVICSLPYP